MEIPKRVTPWPARRMGDHHGNLQTQLYEFN
jgi:hypothetical protein